MNVSASPATPRGLRIRPLLYLSCFILLVLLSRWTQHVYAQTAAAMPATAADNGTLPPGTIPGGVLYLPLVRASVMITNPATFSAIAVQGPPVDHPAAINGDLNLSLRGYISKTAALTLVDIDGPVDSDAPQLAGLFNPPRVPKLLGAYQVYDWNWGCGPDGCRGTLLAEPEVTLLELGVTTGEPIYIPSRNTTIFSGGYKALVLYAEAQRITLVYTRQDTPAVGYVVQLEDVVVDPALLALYTQLNAAGRSTLPALHTNERLGIAAGPTIKVAIRDTGSFLDPRSRKDWWKGF